MTLRASEATILPRIVLCDLDDTILDDYAGIESAWHRVCRDTSERAEDIDANRLFNEIARTRQWYWSDAKRHRQGRLDLLKASQFVLHKSLLSLGFDMPSMARDLAGSYRDLREQELRLFPGAVAALKRMRLTGIRLGLITNGEASVQRAKLERFNLTRWFDHVVIEGEFGVGKPDQRVYTASMKALDASPCETWCVGDNLEWEVAAPQSLGIYSIWVDSRGRGLPRDHHIVPDRTIRSLSELP